MTFNVIRHPSYLPSEGSNVAYLVRDNWDDWGYKTQFDLIIFDSNGKIRHIGKVKIGHIGLTSNGEPVSLPENFETLGDDYFSVGQGENYYLALNSVGPTIRIQVLTSLRDIAHSPVLYSKVRDEHSLTKSLLRDISDEAVREGWRVYREAKRS